MGGSATEGHVDGFTERPSCQRRFCRGASPCELSEAMLQRLLCRCSTALKTKRRSRLRTSWGAAACGAATLGQRALSTPCTLNCNRRTTTRHYSA